MIFLGGANLILLLMIAFFCLHHHALKRGEIVILGSVGIWASLIFTGHVLSAFQQLANAWLYLPVSCALLTVLLAGVNWLSKRERTEPLLPPTILPELPALDGAWRKPVVIGCLVLFALAALCSIWIAMSVYPINADSVSYRLPRAFWYAGHGSLTHPFPVYDPRVAYYPLNGVLLYLPLVIFQAPGTFFSLPSLLSWFGVALLTYRFARTLGAGRDIAFVTMTLAAITPNVLVQATSTNDEIISAVMLLAAVYLLVRWAQTAQSLYFVFAAMAAGISIGTKLHIFFYLPVLLIALVLMVRSILAAPDKFHANMKALGPFNIIAAVALGLMLIMPFLFYNHASTGRFYFTGDFAKDFFNVTGSPLAFLQNLVFYTAQIVLAPIADLFIYPDLGVREGFHKLYNAMLAPAFKAIASDNPDFYQFSYRFQGITHMVAPQYLEFSLWMGFMWLVWPVVWFSAFMARAIPARWWWLCLAGTPLVWFLFWCASTKFMEGVPTYLAYYLIVASPMLVFFFVKQTPVRRALLGVVLVTNTLIGFALFGYNSFRNVTMPLTSTRFPVDWEQMDQLIIDEIKAAPAIKVTFMKWGLAYFAFMRNNPAAYYYGPMDDVKPSARTLVIYPVLTSHDWGFIPLQIPNKETVGATFVGTMQGWGREAVFMIGRGIEKRFPTQSNFVVLHLKTDDAAKTGKFVIESEAAGFNPDDVLEFQYTLLRNGAVVATRAWAPGIGWEEKAPADLLSGTYQFKVEVRPAGESDVTNTFIVFVGRKDQSWAETLSQRVSHTIFTE